MRSDGDPREEEATGEIPVVSPVDPRVSVVGADVAADIVEPEEESILPHWTEAPTGQVPAVLNRDQVSDSDDPWNTIPAPAWRENEADWVAHDETFDASMLTGETQQVEEDKPFVFLDEEPAARDEDILDETPRPAPSRPMRTRRPAHNPMAGRAARSAGNKNVPLATLTGVIAALVVVVLFEIGTVAVMGLIAVVVVLAAAEAYQALRAVSIHPATLIGLVGVLALSLAAYNKGEAALGLVSVVFLFFAVLWYLFADKKIDVLDGIGATIFVYFWIGILGSFAALMVSPINYPDRHGLAFLFGTIAIVVANDVGALFAGRAFGKRPLSPNISPNKTVEGFAGGALAAILMGLIIGAMLHPWTVGSAFVIAIVISIVAPIGDLFESLVKRTLGIKDMGDLLPGHGGVLDRVDGLVFALPATYYLVHVLHVG